MADCCQRQFWRANLHLTLYSNNHQWIEIARHIRFSFAVNFDFRRIINFFAEHLPHRAIAAMITSVRVSCELEAAIHAVFQILHECQRVFTVAFGRAPVDN